MEFSGKLLWNIKEAALALGLSPWTIRRYITDGRIASVKVGRRVLIEPNECRRFVDAQKRDTGGSRG